MAAKARKETTVPPKDNRVKAPNDAWTGMLAISLLALIAGCVLLFLDWSQYPDKEPPAVKKFVPAPPAAAQQAPAEKPNEAPKVEAPKAEVPKGK